MKKIISLFLVAALLYGAAGAQTTQTTISALPNGGLMQQTDTVPMVRSGVTMKAHPYIWPNQGSLMISNGTSAPSGLVPTNGKCVVGANNAWTSAACTFGTVTSVALSGGSTGISVSGSPVISNGTFTLGGVLNATSGGTNQSAWTLGDILYSNGTNSLARLSGNSSAIKQFLSQTGNGSISAAPIWLQIAAADLSNGTTGSGSVVLSSSPSLTTPNIGAATATSINNVALTTPATASTLTIANNKTLTANNTLTLSGTDGSTLNFGAGGTLGTAAFQNTGTSGATIPLLNAANTWSANVLFTDNSFDIGASGATRPRTGYFGTSVVAPSFVGALTGNASTATNVAVGGITGLGTGIATWLATPTSANLAAALTDETGTGASVFAGSPAFTGTVTGSAVTWSSTNTAATFVPTSSSAPTNGMYLPSANKVAIIANSNTSLTVDDTNGAILSGRPFVTQGSIGVSIPNSVFMAMASSQMLLNNNATSPAGFGFYTGQAQWEQLNISHVASAVNTLDVHGSVSGSDLPITATGTDTNISISEVPKGNGGVKRNGNISNGTKFTITGCSAGTTVGGATAGTFNSGTTGACTVVITMAGATGLVSTNGWSCDVNNQTTANLIRETASTTTTATVSGTTVTGDVINFACTGF